MIIIWEKTGILSAIFVLDYLSGFDRDTRDTQVTYAPHRIGLPSPSRSSIELISGRSDQKSCCGRARHRHFFNNKAPDLLSDPPSQVSFISYALWYKSLRNAFCPHDIARNDIVCFSFFIIWGIHCNIGWNIVYFTELISTTNFTIDEN